MPVRNTEKITVVKKVCCNCCLVALELTWDQ